MCKHLDPQPTKTDRTSPTLEYPIPMVERIVGEIRANVRVDLAIMHLDAAMGYTISDEVRESIEKLRNALEILRVDLEARSRL